MATVLMPLPDEDFDVTEVAVPWRLLRDAGHRAVFSTEKGGSKTTCLPKYMERLAYYLTFWKLGKYYRTYSAYVEDEVRDALPTPRDYHRGHVTLGKRGTSADHSPAFVVEDGRYVSARWPGDAYLFSERFIALL